jgi:hypothetical protein
MGQTSRIVTIIEGVQVIEVTTNDQEGDPTETRYQVRGEKYETLNLACSPFYAFSTLPSARIFATNGRSCFFANRSMRLQDMRISSTISAAVLPL